MKLIEFLSPPTNTPGAILRAVDFMLANRIEIKQPSVTASSVSFLAPLAKASRLQDIVGEFAQVDAHRDEIIITPAEELEDPEGLLISIKAKIAASKLG